MPVAQVQVLAHTFLKEVQESSDKLKSYFAARNWPALRGLAHQLKPAYYLMGITEVLPFIDYLLHLNGARPDEAELESGLLNFLLQIRQLEDELNIFLATGAVLA